MSNGPDGADDRYAIRGDHPDAQMLRFVSGLADYDPDERKQTVGVMRTVFVVVLVASALLVGIGFLLM
jgi:hypothetical protein